MKVLLENWKKYINEAPETKKKASKPEKKTLKQVIDELDQLSNGTFIYFDTDHSYEYLSKELKVWYPKVKMGGVLAGHDYSGDVERAVKEFFAEDVGSVFGTFSYSWVVTKQFERSISF